MSTFGLIEYKDASAEVRAIYDDILITRKTDYINNFWKAIAHDPALLKRTWEDLKAIMGPGAIDPLTKETDLYRGECHQQLPLLHRVSHCVRIRQGHDARNVQGTPIGDWHGQRNQ